MPRFFFFLDEVTNNSLNMTAKSTVGSSRCHAVPAENLSRPTPLPTVVTTQGTGCYVTTDRVVTLPCHSSPTISIPPPPPPPPPARPVTKPMPRPTSSAPATTEPSKTYARLAVTPELLRTVTLRPMDERKLNKSNGKSSSAVVAQATVSSKNDSASKPDDIRIRTNDYSYKNGRKQSDDNGSTAQTKNTTDSQRLVMPNFLPTTPEDIIIVEHSAENDSQNTKSKSHLMPDIPPPILPRSIFGQPKDEKIV